jgi:hypothetical protein
MRPIQLDPQNHRQVHQFVEFPFKLYENFTQWVPPLIGDMHGVFDRNRHPFYEHSDAAFFIVESERDVIGRIAVLHNRNFCKHHNIDLGFIYYFDSVDDPQVSNALMQSAEDWCRQRGLVGIYGPKGFSRSDSLGTLVEGFEHRAAFGMLYNFAYYDKLIRQAGFRKFTDFLSGYMSREKALPEKIYAAADRIRERGSFWIKKFKTKAEMRKWIPEVDRINYEAFKTNPGFLPSTPAEFRRLANNIIQIADPRMIVLVMKGEEVAGFILVYPDIAAAVQRNRGQLLPLGWLDMLLEMKRTDTISLNGVGMLPKYQGMGANILVYTELDKILRPLKNVKRGEFLQVDEKNFKSRSDMETIGADWVKRHRVYIKPLVPESQFHFESEFPSGKGEQA